MSESTTFLRVLAAGRELLLATQDLREVVLPSPITPLPGGPTGIQGVVIYEGEFLPILAWGDFPGGADAAGACTALAVLRPRLGLPIERLLGTVEAAPGGWSAPSPGDPWAPILAGQLHLDGLDLPLLDADRLIAVLHGLHGDR